MIILVILAVWLLGVVYTVTVPLQIALGLLGALAVVGWLVRLVKRIKAKGAGK